MTKAAVDPVMVTNPKPYVHRISLLPFDAQ